MAVEEIRIIGEVGWGTWSQYECTYVLLVFLAELVEAQESMRKRFLHSLLRSSKTYGPILNISCFLKNRHFMMYNGGKLIHTLLESGNISPHEEILVHIPWCPG